MRKEKLKELYFKWLLKHVCDNYQLRYYDVLLGYLFFKEFTWTMEFDDNCAAWGLDLRDRFYNSSSLAAKYLDIEGPIDGPCSILEMMISLSISCEENIMTDMEKNRTSEWFWLMIQNLGLDNYDDGRWDEMEVERIISDFLSRNYSKDGLGGLFYIKNCSEDLREVPIWYQMNIYLRSIMDI